MPATPHSARLAGSSAASPPGLRQPAACPTPNPRPPTTLSSLRPDSISQAGLPEGFHFHDLRHTGNTLAAGTGASLADLMARVGHGSARAAMIYQHAIQQHDTMIADALSLSIQVERDRARNGHEPAEEA
jgi:integrase